ASVGVGTRMLFGGNLLKQPAFVQLRSERPEALRLVEPEMPGADLVMERALFLGTFPGLTEAMIDREIALIQDFVADFADLPL
ncbi:MAG: lipopolysaccharide biosynthesis protein RfbH, partial [Synechococcaceae cyanobacterium ELA182]